MVRFEIFPVVREEDDQRQNKLSDYSIFRVYNKVTYIVVEVKLAIGAILTAADKDNLAQLFLEVYYVNMQEQSSRSVLCILTDGTTWHLICTDVSCTPFKFLSLCTVGTAEKNKPWDSNVNIICDQCTAHVMSVCHYGDRCDIIGFSREQRLSS